MGKKEPDVSRRARVLVLVDESNVGSSVRTAGRGLDWLRLRDFLAGPESGRELIEMVVYAGLPPPIPLWQEERDKKNKFVHWLRSNGFMVVTKDGAPAEEGQLQGERGCSDGDRRARAFGRDAARRCYSRHRRCRFRLSRHQIAPAWIHVEVASVAQNLGNVLRSAANAVIDLAPLFRTFELMPAQDVATPSRQATTPASLRRKVGSKKVEGRSD
jgi:uncharacterized LabA/DUF88 family protein